MINKIYAFGTSHTAGGGFEFNTINDSPNPDLYKQIINSENHFDFSYPSLLGNLTNIEIDNRSKQGYGLQKVIREIFSVLDSKDFDKESSLFLIEVTDWSRQEFWLRSINDFVVVNSYDDITITEDEISIANDYFFQNYEVKTRVNNSRKVFCNFLTETYNKDILIKKLQNDFLLLINLLENNNIKYYLTNGDLPISPNLNNFVSYKDKMIDYQFYDNINHKFFNLNSWTDKVSDFNLTILTESSNQVKDNHQGLSVNIYISKVIYNKMIDDRYINGNHIDTNMKDEWNSIRNQLKVVL